jgi:hypothetical protein
MPTSRTEAVARALFAHYLPFLKPRYNLRPDWLRWPVTGNRLELDISWPDIQQACEIDGIQHGRFIASMHRDFAAFERQQARDLWKLEECRRRGITVHKLTIFDLTEQRFPAKLRTIIAAGKEAVRGTDPALYDRLVYAAERLPYIVPPTHLYAEAERLSRQKFRPPKPKRPGWWQRLCVRFRGV